MEQAKEKADKRLHKADDDVEQLHQARKAEKRLRYAAELVEPADRRMKGTVRKAKDLQIVLGEHQDAVVAANFLSTVSAVSDGKSGSGFTYGVLVANELNRTAGIRASLRNSRPAVPTPGEAHLSSHQAEGVMVAKLSFSIVL